MASLGDSVPRLPASFTLDGKHLVYTDKSGRNLGGIFTLSIDEATVTPIVKTVATLWGPTLSPDGNWLAYASDESGDPQIYVRSLTKGGRWQVSEAGSHVRWSPDGSRLIVVQRTTSADTTRHLNVVVDWSASLVD